MQDVATYIDVMDPDLIEAARSELSVCERRIPEVAALATVASLARSIEPELLRSLRLGLGSQILGRRISVSAESALWFSNFVESRGADAITLLPEALQVLRPRLANDPQLLEDARAIIEDCHKSAPDVLQWEERIVYLALTGKTSLMEDEVMRGLRSISSGTRRPLVNWISDMWLRLPPQASSNPLILKLHRVASGLTRRRAQKSSGQKTSPTDLILDFSSFPTRELGVVLRNNRFVIGDLPDAEFGIPVPDLETIELDTSFGNDPWAEQLILERGQTTEIDVAQHHVIRVRTLAGQIYELNPAFFGPPAKRFAVALSFPGVLRGFVESIVEQLAAHLGRERILYDKYLKAELARPNLDAYLSALYREQSELIVVFLASEYSAQDRSRAGWEQVRALLASDNADRVLAFGYGGSGILSDLGLPSSLGYIDLRDHTPQTVAQLIFERLKIQTNRPPRVSSPPVDVSRIYNNAPAEFIGREEELRRLRDSWEQAVRGERNRPHILSLVGLGGEGKSSLVAKWMGDLARENWPGCDAVFAWSFYSEGTLAQSPVSSDSFLAEALKFFGDDAMAGSAAGAFEKGRWLAKLVGERRALLVLDGLDPLQNASTSSAPGELRDEGVATLLNGLAVHNLGLCIVTTRYPIPVLHNFGSTIAPEINLNGLSIEAGLRLLRRLGLNGTNAELAKLVEDVKGHALTLNLFGSYLRDVHGGDIRKRDLVKLEEVDAEKMGGGSFSMYEAYAQWLESEGDEGEQAVALLHLMSLFDRPATLDRLNALWKGEVITGLTESLIGLSESERNKSLSRLEQAKLVSVNRNTSSGEVLSVDAHPLLREYFARKLQVEQPGAWQAANRRLYEYLCTTTSDVSEPTIEDLQPLAEAIWFGCRAGMHQQAFDEVYIQRMQLGHQQYLRFKLGAFNFDLSVLANFFEQPLSGVTPNLSEAAKAFVLESAGFDLRSLGRLAEALMPLRAALEMRIQQEDWMNAAMSAGNISEIELTLGEIASAVAGAEQSVNYADRTIDATQPISKRETLADALHQAGRWHEAVRVFHAAENMQTTRQTAFPLLYSLGGFRYCDLLLAEPGRVAWQTTLKLETQNTEKVSAAESCISVKKRTTQTLKWTSEMGDILGSSLDHLTLGRTALYVAILEKLDVNVEAEIEIESALSGLRRAGQQNYLPLALLSRAWQRRTTGNNTGPDSAQTDLDEAWEIAERGLMRLHMADIHLYRARLFHDVKPYPWAADAEGNARGPKDDLTAARKLIEQCGYWRRKDELEDAEAVVKQTSERNTMEFDVFLSHNSRDKPAVRQLKQSLQAHGLRPWLDADELVPGENWQPGLIEGIMNSTSMAVCIGSAGVGPWEDEEMQGALTLAVREKKRVIPVVLPGAPEKPEISLFLSSRTWVDLRAGFADEGIARLVWGITGVKPSFVSSGSESHDETRTADDRTILPRPADRPGWSRAYSDKTVKAVAVALEEARPLTMRALVLNLDGLFNRGTFRFEPLRECVTQEWGRRLLPAMETLELLRSYSSVVSDLAPDTRSFEKLMDSVNGYCLAMATDLFAEPVKVSEMRDYLGTDEFLSRLPKAKLWPSAAEIDDATNKRVDGPRTRAVRLMDKLRKEFLKAPRPDEPDKEPTSNLDLD